MTSIGPLRVEMGKLDRRAARVGFGTDFRLTARFGSERLEPTRTDLNRLESTQTDLNRLDQLN